MSDDSSDHEYPFSFGWPPPPLLSIRLLQSVHAYAHFLTDKPTDLGRKDAGSQQNLKIADPIRHCSIHAVLAPCQKQPDENLPHWFRERKMSISSPRQRQVLPRAGIACGRDEIDFARSMVLFNEPFTRWKHGSTGLPLSFMHTSSSAVFYYLVRGIASASCWGLALVWWVWWSKDGIVVGSVHFH